MNANLLWLLPALPLLGSLLAGILHFRVLAARRSHPDAPQTNGLTRTAGWIAIAAMAAGFVVSLNGFLHLRGLDPHSRVLESSVWPWIDAGTFRIDLSMVLDPLSAIMCLVITGVGTLIHVYSFGYMKGDPGFAKFFSYLNLFVCAMLMLVLSSNLMGLFVGWEGVGLCSYLLIGFWYEKGWPAEAGQKAFVVNRIGDACFLVGSFLLAGVFSTLDLSDIGGSVAGLLESDPARAKMLGLAALCLFGGACGKSAQFPLFTWLPDAMAGPTPVSALIHAATMVTAGVYLIVRLNPLFAAAPGVLLVIATVGAATAFIGASSALRQTDLKKVLAYSTVSQLGFMFLALGSGAWVAAVFHLVTHAFFKGLLFLGAGSVIHGMHEEQDMREMGGLHDYMRTTYLTFLVGSAALAGLPGLSGFFSKDEILALTFAHGGFHGALWVVGLLSAAMTAYYTWRMVAMTFHGQPRFNPRHVHPHESPASMTVPLAVLSVLALFGGLLNLPAVLPMHGVLHHWLEPVTAVGDALLFGDEVPHLSHALEWVLLGVGAAIALCFAHLGFHRYKNGPGADGKMAAERPQLAAFLGRAWGIDDAYNSGVVGSVKLAAFGVAGFIDTILIDGIINACGAVAQRAADSVRFLADGNLKSYALWMSAGATALALFWIWI